MQDRLGMTATRRITRAQKLSVQCPFCGASPGSGCIARERLSILRRSLSWSGPFKVAVHKERRDKYVRENPE